LSLKEVSADRSEMHDNNLILVVDDDPSMLKGLQRLLRRDDYEPAVFSTIRDF
jgi:FixJ family two-component response regulator